MLKGLIRYCLSQTSSLMCHNSLSEPCPHLVRWLMGISIIGIPIATLLTSLSCISPLLTSYPKIPPGPNRSVWQKCQTQSGSGVNTHIHGSHTARQPSFHTNAQNSFAVPHQISSFFLHWYLFFALFYFTNSACIMCHRVHVLIGWSAPGNPQVDKRKWQIPGIGTHTYKQSCYQYICIHLFCFCLLLFL